MRVLVIGGAGYIGSHVALALGLAKHEVHVFDNLSNGLRENLLAGNGFSHGDINNFQSVREVLKEFGPFDAAVHLAAYKAVGESMIKPEKYSVNNLGGTINILNALVEFGVKAIVFSSSAAVFGEPQYVPIDENHPTNPENYYGFTKLEIERILGWYSKLKGLHFAALRYFNAAGYDPEGRIAGLERNPANLIPIVMEVAVGLRPKLGIYGNDYPTPDGTCIRDYIHVSDLAEAHVKALEYVVKETRDLIINLGSESGISVQEMVEGARKVTGLAIPSEFQPRRPGDPARLVASSKKAAELLKWKTTRSDIVTLISSSYQAYRKHYPG